jgi:hypothetical protein
MLLKVETLHDFVVHTQETARTCTALGLTARMSIVNQTAAHGGDVAGASIRMLRTSGLPEYLEHIDAAIDLLTDATCLGVQKELAFHMASVAQQARFAKLSASANPLVDAFPKLENVMLKLAARTGRVPRDDAHTQWVTLPYLSFTASEGEERFANAVREIDGRMNKVADLLSSIRLGVVTFADGAPILDQARVEVEHCRKAMSDLAKNPFPDDFQAMRNFLVPLVVGGQEYEPPNATYAMGWNRADVAIGIVDRRFDNRLNVAIKHMSRDEAAKVRLELCYPTIAQIAEMFDPEHVGNPSKADGIYVAATKAAAELAREQARLTGVHYGATRTNLPKPGGSEGPEGGPPHGADGAAVLAPQVTHEANKGVSGRSTDELVELLKMRQDHPLTRRR